VLPGTVLHHRILQENRASSQTATGPEIRLALAEALAGSLCGWPGWAARASAWSPSSCVRLHQGHPAELFATILIRLKRCKVSWRSRPNRSRQKPGALEGWRTSCHSRSSTGSGCWRQPDWIARRKSAITAVATSDSQNGKPREFSRAVLPVIGLEPACGESSSSSTARRGGLSQGENVHRHAHREEEVGRIKREFCSGALIGPIDCCPENPAASHIRCRRQGVWSHRKNVLSTDDSEARQFFRCIDIKDRPSR